MNGFTSTAMELHLLKRQTRKPTTLTSVQDSDTVKPKARSRKAFQDVAQPVRTPSRKDYHKHHGHTKANTISALDWMLQRSSLKRSSLTATPTLIENPNSSSFSSLSLDKSDDGETLPSSNCSTDPNEPSYYDYMGLSDIESDTDYRISTRAPVTRSRSAISNRDFIGFSTYDNLIIMFKKSILASKNEGLIKAPDGRSRTLVKLGPINPSAVAEVCLWLKEGCCRLTLWNVASVAKVAMQLALMPLFLHCQNYMLHFLRITEADLVTEGVLLPTDISLLQHYVRNLDIYLDRSCVAFWVIVKTVSGWPHLPGCVSMLTDEIPDDAQQEAGRTNHQEAVIRASSYLTHPLYLVESMKTAPVAINWPSTEIPIVPIAEASARPIAGKKWGGTARGVIRAARFFQRARNLSEGGTRKSPEKAMPAKTASQEPLPPQPKDGNDKLAKTVKEKVNKNDAKKDATTAGQQYETVLAEIREIGEKRKFKKQNKKHLVSNEQSNSDKKNERTKNSSLNKMKTPTEASNNNQKLIVKTGATSNNSTNAASKFTLSVAKPKPTATTTVTGVRRQSRRSLLPSLEAAGGAKTKISSVPTKDSTKVINVTAVAGPSNKSEPRKPISEECNEETKLPGTPKHSPAYSVIKIIPRAKPKTILAMTP